MWIPTLSDADWVFGSVDQSMTPFGRRLLELNADKVIVEWEFTGSGFGFDVFIWILQGSGCNSIS